MKKAWNFLNTALGLGLMVVLALVLAALFGGRNVVGPTGQPLATAVVEQATPTSTPGPPLSVENIRIARRYPLEVEGKVLEGNPWNLYLAPIFSPDGATMLFRKPVPAGQAPECKGWACGMILSELWRTDAQGGSPQLLAERAGGVAWSPDGKWIAYTRHTPTGESSLWIMRSDGSERQKLTDDIGSSRLGWLNESTIVYISSSGSLISMSLDKRSVEQFRPSQIPYVTRFAISPQGDRLTLTTEAEVWLVDLEKPEEPMSITPYYGAFGGSIAWSPNENKVAYSSQSSIYIVNKDGEHITEVQTAWYPSHLVWSPDGRVLAFIGRTEQRGFSFEIYLTNAEGVGVKQLTDDEENVAGGHKYSLTWSPDGSKLIYGTSQLPGQNVQVIEITTKKRGERERKAVPIAESERQTSHPFALSVSSGRTPALSDCPYQEGSDGTIWVYRQEHDSEFPPRTRQIPFEIGIYEEDPTWSNYLGGVLEYEIGGTTETPLENWQPEMARGFSVAARTVAIFWCPYPTSIVTDVNGITHYGLDDHTYQTYWPGHAVARAEDYRGFVADTESEYLTYGGNLISGLQYRDYTGRMTVNAEPNGPHKGIYDPVAAQDESSATGLGQHSANHWAMGLHNEHLGEPVNVPNVQWVDYRQILVHYYTGVHIEEHGGAIFTPDDRWNLLDHTVLAEMEADQSYNVTLVLQNTSTWAWTSYSVVLAYQWTAPGVSPTHGDWQIVVEELSLATGQTLTTTVGVMAPAVPGTYDLHWDFARPDEDYFWFNGGGWPHPTMPITVTGGVTPTPTPTLTPTPTNTPTPIPPTPTSTPTTEPGPCAAEAALSEASPAERESILGLLWRVRDEMLAKEAQSYIDLYEKHSPEAAVILLRDEKLRGQAGELLMGMEPALRSLVDEKAGPVVVKAEQVAAADAVLAGLQARASSELAAEIERWRERLPEFEGKTAREIWVLVSE